MKPRKVVITMEVMTDVSLKSLRKKENYSINIYSDEHHAETLTHPIQVQINVIKEDK